MKISLIFFCFLLSGNPFKKQPDSYFNFNKETPDNSSMVLLDKQQNKITLEDLLKKHKGKVIYIDFWASWCKPCRLALPHSKQLKETLKDIPVVFVYLSIDEMTNPWKQASIKDGLDGYSENYLVYNPLESEFIKKHRISSIPRYMIYDQNGTLVDAMAPGPVNEDAESVLKKLAGVK
ncbi:redoxin domain-containing protein [Emticicia sp. CRIBPO]|uniref:TlpA family protein disulfide reductase n=1 Tax=Emticicia sp. CRIBPO TaxID=2683258 RepID=UPI0014128E36|nr:TlpA disulfide reductase family protein [Emticicia sp. CRIBPO]NBA85159.1 redoxin domain-containing protein [Emticicia sp. CRIBPO]